ncbi:hypothetical protein [Oceaniglobus roseus]|uniref:hypothetical protein n=1 Tax=Oceaniglobus roseus TaxID=1737570 RepID=UPI000C7EAA94|nr:hypothetical protein [Kandeliimicrobium roseum]
MLITKKPIRMTPMKRLPLPKAPPAARPLPTTGQNAQDIAALQARVLELEARLAALESVVQVQGQDVVIAATGSVLVSAATSVEVTAGAVIRASAALSEVSTGMFKVSGAVQCDTLIANSVVAASYTPGAGNVM